jgi:hypothetical protein
MKTRFIVAILACLLLVGLLAGCVDKGTPKYIAGDIIAEKPTADTFLVILDYNQNTDEYKTNYIFKDAGEWRYLVETKHESWENRRDKEDIYPVKIDHVDLATVMSWDEHLKEMGYGVSATPTTKPKYSPEKVSTTPTPKYIAGDIIAREENKDIAWVILDYNQKNDEYQKNFIFKDAGEWRHLAETKEESWEDRAYTENIRPLKIGHVDLATVMSWDEYWNEGDYEEVLAIPTPSPTPKVTPKPTLTPIPTPKPTQKSGITGIKIIYSGKWSGSYGDLSGMKSIEGSGSKTISMPDANMIISAAIQKQDDSNRKLTLQILKNGKVMEESDTTAAYGVVSAAHTISAF